MDVLVQKTITCDANGTFPSTDFTFTLQRSTDTNVTDKHEAIRFVSWDVTGAFLRYGSGNREGEYYFDFTNLPQRSASGNAYTYRIIEYEDSVGEYVKIYYPSTNDSMAESGFKPADNAPMAPVVAGENLSFRLQYSDNNGETYTDLTGQTLTLSDNNAVYSSATGTITVPHSSMSNNAYSLTVDGLGSNAGRLYRVNDVTGGTDVKVIPTENNPSRITITASGYSKYFQGNTPLTRTPGGGTYETYVRNIFLGKEIKLKKRWDDGNNADGQRPEMLDITLHETILSSSDTPQVTKLMRNDESWERTVLLPRYYYNGDLPLYNVQFYITEDLKKARQYYDKGESLADLGYTQTEQGYITTVTAENSTDKITKDIPNDFTSENLSGTADDNFVGLYIVNHKDYVKSELKFEKQWDDNDSSARPDSIYIKTLRRTKGSLLPNADGVYAADRSTIDFEQQTIFQNLPRFVSVPAQDNQGEPVRYPLIYFIESDKISPTMINRDADGIGTVDVTVNLSKATSHASFVLKRRVASYPYQTYTSQTVTSQTVGTVYQMTIPAKDAINGFFSFKIKDLPIAEEGINYLYRITDAYGTKLELPMTHSTTGENTKDIIIGPVPSGSKDYFVFKLQRFDGEYELDNETGEQKLDEEGQPIPIYHDVESFTAETYFDETTPLIIYPAANVSDQENTHYGSARYKILASDKIGGVYAFKVMGLTAGVTCRILNALTGGALAESTADADGTAIFTVSGMQEELVFYLQQKSNDTYTDILYANADTITVGKYYEEVVKQDKNGTALRLEYFPANVVTDTVLFDHYGNQQTVNFRFLPPMRIRSATPISSSPYW